MPLHEMIPTPSHAQPALPRTPAFVPEKGQDKAPESVEQPKPVDPTLDDWYDNVACTD